MRMLMTTLSAIVAAITIATPVPAAPPAPEARKENDWTMPEINLPARTEGRPVIAATPAEIQRLRAAYERGGAERAAIDARIGRAEKLLDQPLVVPPHSGQHNQWYQCEKCQESLKTVDATNHQCPKCQTVYSGFPYDNVLYSRQHGQNFYRMDDAGWGYAITGRREFADYAARIMLAYAEIYETMPWTSAHVRDREADVSKLPAFASAGRLDNQTLNEAMLMCYLAPAYDFIYDSGALTADQRRKVENHLIRPMLETISKHRAGKSNWQTWHNAAFLFGGAVLGDPSWVERAISEAGNGFASQMTTSVSPEGIWYENSWGYHYYTLRAMTLLAEGSRRLGLDIYSHPLLKKMYLVPFDYLMADGSLPRFGDSVQTTLNADYAHEPAFAAYGDQRLLSALPSKPTFDSILHGRDVSLKGEAVELPMLTVLPGAGNALFQMPEPKQMSAAFAFSPFGGFHAHFDQLSFVSFAYGHEMAVDHGRRGSQAYRLPSHSQWYRSTVSHNAIIIDGKGQGESDGILLGHNHGTVEVLGTVDGKPAKNIKPVPFAAVYADAGPKAYEDVHHRRLLVMTDEFLLVFDELRPTDMEKEHTYEWLYHNKGTKAVNRTSDMGQGQVKLTDNPGYEYLGDAVGYILAGTKSNPERPLNVRFEVTDQLLLSLTSLPRAGDRLLIAHGPLKDNDDRVPMLALQRKVKGQAIFLTILEPIKGGGKPQWQVAMPSSRSTNSWTFRAESLDIAMPGLQTHGWIIYVSRSDEKADAANLLRITLKPPAEEGSDFEIEFEAKASR